MNWRYFRRAIKILYFIICLLTFYYSILSFLNYNPSQVNFAPNEEKLYGAIYYGVIPGLPFTYFAMKQIDLVKLINYSVWKLVILNIFNIVLGYLFWIKALQFVIFKIYYRKRHHDPS